MPARTKTKNAQGTFLTNRIGKINSVIGKLEREVEKTVERIRVRGEKSSRVLKKNFDEVIEKISSSEFYALAQEKTGELSKEVRHLADEVIEKVRGFDLRVGNGLFREVRANLDQIVEKLQSTEIMEKAKDSAVHTRDRVLHILSIPSRDDVTDLSRRVVSLEKKVHAISRKAPPAAAA